MDIPRPLKPPIGVKPKQLVEIDNIQDKINGLVRAINDYTTEYRIVNPEWLAEYNELITKLEKL